MFGIDPVTLGVGTLVWLAFRKQTNSNHGVLTPEREEIFRNAMQHCQDPMVLNNLAGKFQNEGLKSQAFILRNRAQWRGRSDEKRKEHAAIFDKAMASENVQGILAVASAFEQMTATFNAQQLRQRVQELNEAALQAETALQTAKAEEAAKKAKETPKPEDTIKAAAKTVAESKPEDNIPGNTEVIR